VKWYYVFERLFLPGAKSYDIVIIVTSYQADQAVQRRQFRRLLRGPKVVVVYLPTHGGGPMLDTMRAFRAAKEEIPDLEQLWQSGKKIALYLNAGEGRRDSPLTQSENNSRGAIRIAGDMRIRKRYLPVTLLNSAYAQNNFFASANGYGNWIDVYYANQVYVPSKPNFKFSEKQPLVKLVTEVLEVSEITDDTVGELGMFELNRDGVPLRSLPKNTFKSGEEGQAWFLQAKAQGHRVMFSLGSHRIRRDFFFDLEHYFEPLLPNPKALLEPPDLIAPLLVLGELYAVMPKQDWSRLSTTNEVFAAADRYDPSGELLKRLQSFPRHTETIGFFLQYRFRYGENPRDWFGCANVGPRIFWWRYRWPLSILNNQLLLLSDLSGRRSHIDAQGRAVSVYATPRDKEEARVLRLLHHLEVPIASVHLGDVFVDRFGRRSDTGKRITVEEIQQGFDVGGVYIRGSIVANSHLASGSRVINSVIDHWHGEIDVENSYLQRGSGERLTARGSLDYNLVLHQPLTAEAAVVADVFREGIPEHPGKSLLANQTRLWVDLRVDASQADNALLARNSYTFNQVREMHTDPGANADLRQVVKAQMDRKVKFLRLGPGIKAQQKIILVIGAKGFLGKKIFQTLSRNFSMVFGTALTQTGVGIYHLDVTNPAEVEACMKRFNPDVVVYAAGDSYVERVESEPAHAQAVDVDALRTIAKYRTSLSMQFIYLSSDYVFDGQHPPHAPLDAPHPLNRYGAIKAQGEALARSLFSKAAIVRTGVLYGYNDPSDRSTFVSEVVRHLDQNVDMVADNLQIRHPALIDEVATLILSLIQREVAGIFHIDGLESVHKHRWALEIARVYFHIFPQSIQDLSLRDVLSRFVPKRLVDMGTRPYNSKLRDSAMTVPLRRGLERVVRRLSSQLKGDSYSRTVRVQRDGEWIVRKEAFAKGRDALEQQILWLNRIPEEVRARFAPILSYEINEIVAYEMPYYPYPTLSQWMVDDLATTADVLPHLHNVLSFYAQNIMSGESMPVPENYVRSFLIQKIYDRLAETVKLAPKVFADVVEAPTLVINGETYTNLRPLLKEIESSPDLIARLTPSFHTLVHGDLHFDNILVDREDPAKFILLDPRGDRSGDPLYDVAKLMNTVVGKYDVFNYNLHNTRLRRRDGSISIVIQYPTDRILWQTYKELERELPRLINQTLLQDPRWESDSHWVERLAFTHAALFASGMPFHLKGDGLEERALALYATAVMLMNEFMDLVKGPNKNYHGFPGSPKIAPMVPLEPKISDPIRFVEPHPSPFWASALFEPPDIRVFPFVPLPLFSLHAAREHALHVAA